MKKPLFNLIERQIIREDDSFAASYMMLDIAKKKLEKAFLKTLIGRFVVFLVEWLSKRIK